MKLSTTTSAILFVVLGFNFQVWRYIPFIVAGVFNLLQYGLFALTRICTEGKNDANCAIVLYASSRFIIVYCVDQISLKISEQLAKKKLFWDMVQYVIGVSSSREYSKCYRDIFFLMKRK